MQSSIVAILCFVFKSLQPNPSFSVCWTHCLSHLGCIWRHLNSNDVQWWIKIMILKESIFWCEDFSLWRGGGGLKFLAMSPPPQIWTNLITRKANVQSLFSFHTHTHINTNWFYHRLEGKKLACRSLSAYPSVFSASSTPWDHPWLSGWWTYNKWSSWPLKSLFWPIIIFAQWCHASGVIKPTPHFISPSSFVTS